MDLRLLIILLPLACSNVLIAQDTPAQGIANSAQLDKLSSQYITAVGDKSDKVSRQIDTSTQQYLDHLQKQEARLQKRVAKVDSLAAHNIFASSAGKYQQLQNDLKNKAASLQRSTGQYLGFNDTALTSLKFLSNSSIAGKLPVNPANITDAISKVRNLEGQLKSAENIKEFIRQRRAYLQQQLSKYNLGSSLNKYKQTGFYYTQQIDDYKAALNDQTKAEQKLLSLLRQYGPFQQFMAKNGVLAGLFNTPADYATTGVNGLQTISSVQNMIQSRIAGLGPNGAQMAQNEINAAQAALGSLRNKLSGLGTGGDMPAAFKPSSVKTKPFLKRLIYSFDMTTTKANALIPTFTDLGLSVGYKTTDKLTFSIGASYKLGWGMSLRHVQLSSQGAGLRTGLDLKIKRGFSLAASAEANYLTAFNNLKALQDYSAWSLSALTGICKTVNLRSKFFKCTRVGVLFDWLHAIHIPTTSPVVFRAGYSF